MVFLKLNTHYKCIIKINSLLKYYKNKYKTKPYKFRTPYTESSILSGTAAILCKAKVS